MKTSNKKILQLINHGFSGNLLSDLNEGQINALHKRLVESKKDTKEETQVVTTQLDKNNQQDMAKLNGMLKNPNSLQGKNVQLKEIEVDKDEENIQEGADGDSVLEGEDKVPESEDAVPNGEDSVPFCYLLSEKLEVIGNIFQLPCKPDHNGECIHCDCWLTDCQFLKKKSSKNS